MPVRGAPAESGLQAADLHGLCRTNEFDDDHVQYLKNARFVAKYKNLKEAR
jgi:hypothetical protein